MVPQRARGGEIAAGDVELDAVGAELALLVRQLRRVLHEEAGLADELTRCARPYPAVGAVLGVRWLFLFLFVLVLGDDEALLEDAVEVGFDVVGVEDVVVIVLALLVVGRRLGGRAFLFLLGLLVEVGVDVGLEVVLDEVGVVLLVEVVDVDVVLGLLFLFEVLFVGLYVVSHRILASPAAHRGVSRGGTLATRPATPYGRRARVRRPPHGGNGN